MDTDKWRHNPLAQLPEEGEPLPLALAQAAEAGPPQETRLQQIAAELLALQERREQLKATIAAEQQMCHRLLGHGSLFFYPFIPSLYLLALTPKDQVRIARQMSRLAHLDEEPPFC